MALRTGDLIMDLFKRSPKWMDLQGEELYRLKITLIEITRDIYEVCNRNNLKLIMAYGTALGSVRHKGYIPWDDDIDLYLSRSDYNKFLEIAQKEMGNKYFIRSISKGDNLGVPTIHVKKKGTRYVNYGDLILNQDEPDETKCIYVDIFPLDDSSNVKLFRNYIGIRCLLIQLIISCVHVTKSIDYLREQNIPIRDEEYQKIKLKYTIGKILSFKSMSEWSKVYDSISSKITNPNSKYVTCWVGYKSFKKSVILRDRIFPGVVGEFEGNNWILPNRYDEYLTQIYGDYMTPPPIDKHKIHPIFELSFNTEINES